MGSTGRLEQRHQPVPSPARRQPGRAGSSGAAKAFAAARAADKPLFVSIGYAACHWCHVMAHESFEDPAVAADLDRSFVSPVKVDREERPDVDDLYMAAVQAMTGSGGWPMSVFCTPDGRPISWPVPTSRPRAVTGCPAFAPCWRRWPDAWATRRAEVERQAGAVTEAVRAGASLVDRLVADQPDRPRPSPTGRPCWTSWSDEAVWPSASTPAWGGFGGAPQVPPADVRGAVPAPPPARTGGPRSLQMATTTLDAMAAGGIYDHLAGGFARYSTDVDWLVPHFEKMLTDQALLARAYLHAWQASGIEAYRQVAAETARRRLTPSSAFPGGALGASLDADAAGVEGGHATWTPSEGARRPWTAAGRHGAGRRPVRRLVWHHRGRQLGRAARCCAGRSGQPLPRPAEVEEGRRLLLEARGQRPQPGRDDKVLTEWNAMYIAVLASGRGRAGRLRGAGRPGRWRSWRHSRRRTAGPTGDGCGRPPPPSTHSPPTWPGW